jgi:hypothetical protein
MNWKNGIICSMCGVAFCAHLKHEAHNDEATIARELGRTPIMEALGFGKQYHGEEPDAPSGPLRMPQATIVSTSAASVTAVPQLIGSTGSGGDLRRDLVWNPLTAALSGAYTDPSSGSNVSPTFFTNPTTKQV